MHLTCTNMPVAKIDEALRVRGPVPCQAWAQSAKRA